jgi:hypothetical protein
MAEVVQQPVQSNTVQQPAQQPPGFLSAMQFNSQHISMAVFCVVIAVVTYFAYDHFVKNQGQDKQADGEQQKKESTAEVAGYNLHDALRRISDRQQKINSQLSATAN